MTVDTQRNALLAGPITPPTPQQATLAGRYVHRVARRDQWEAAEVLYALGLAVDPVRPTRKKRR